MLAVTFSWPRKVISHLHAKAWCVFYNVSDPPVTWLNKKVLLRERKRHTTRHVASTRYAALCNGGEGTPGRGVPHLRSRGVYPISGLGGYPISGLGGTPSQVWGVLHLRFGGAATPSQVGGTPSYPDLRWGYPLPRPEIGYPLIRPGMGYPPRPEMGYPPTQT